MANEAIQQLREEIESLGDFVLALREEIRALRRQIGETKEKEPDIPTDGIKAPLVH